MLAGSSIRGRRVERLRATRSSFLPEVVDALLAWYEQERVRA